ncbi:MAG: DUF3048 domain-containing protein [Oscillospiraceae bacterium]
MLTSCMKFWQRGGITRMMAIFSNLEGETPLGSIRSLRPYYLSIARSYDAIMVHAGASEGAYARSGQYWLGPH